MRTRIGIIGVGMVGASFAYALLQSGLATEIVLIDADRARAEGEAMDLEHGTPFTQPTRVFAGDYPDLRDAQIIVITAGANQVPGQTRLELAANNAQVIRDVMPKLLKFAQDPIIVVATNPVDVLTQIAAELALGAGYTAGRIMGTGTTLDTARFRTLLGTHYGVSPKSVHAQIIGEHGDSELALWSTAQIGGVPLKHCIGPNGQGFDEKRLAELFQQTRDAAAEIIKRKRATYYAIGLGVLTIVRTILRNERAVLTVSSPIAKYCQIEGFADFDLSLSVPSVVGARGIEGVFLEMSDEERQAFLKSAEIVKTALQRVNI